MSEERNVSRRGMLQGGLAAALAAGMPPTVARAFQAAQDPKAAAAELAKAAKDATPVNIAWIGTGVQGQNDMRQLVRLPGVKIVAIADIYEPHTKKALEIAGPGCEAYTDYRKLLDRK